MKIKSKLMEIELTKIMPSPRNPRKTASEDELDELAQNIKAQGLLQPITVRPIDGLINPDGTTVDYEIVCGERRFRAVKKNAGNDKNATIACIVREMTDDEAFDAMITENLQRKDVDPIEEAFAFGELVKSGKTEEEIAARFGKTKRFVQERCKLNTLITPLKELTKKGKLPIAGAMMLAKLTEDLQQKYSSDMKIRIANIETSPIEVREINTWISREFMRLDSARFLETDDDEKKQTEDWNHEYPKCATCLMNTGNAGCLFYSMKGDSECTDRVCFEKKNAAYMMYQIEKNADRLTKEGEVMQIGNVVIVDGGEEQYGYENVKRSRKILFDMIHAKGYMVVKPDAFDGMCKYYEGDERIKDLLKQGKVMECITLGTPWCLDIETRYYYTKGNKDADPEETPEQREVRELVNKYNNLLDKMNRDANDELRNWGKEKRYSKRVGTLDKKELVGFWSLIVLGAGSDILREAGATEYSDNKKIHSYVENNLTEENMLRWQRSFIAKTVCDRYSYNELANRVMRDCFHVAYPDDYHELTNKYADKFAKRSEKIKVRLQELGYNIHGEKIEK